MGLARSIALIDQTTAHAQTMIRCMVVTKQYDAFAAAIQARCDAALTATDKAIFALAFESLCRNSAAIIEQDAEDRT